VMSQNLRPLTAEFVGTLLFVFLGAGGVVAFAGGGPAAGATGAVGVALAHGVGMAIIVSMTMSISGGHINPAVTTGLWIANKIDGKLALQYSLAHLLGALVGGNLTGAMMNPARAFGPALINVSLNGQAVYWIGPLIGAAVAAALWKAVLLPRDQ